MQIRQSVKAIGPSDEVRSVFLLGGASLQQSRNGPFWRLELRDATGAVEAKIWSPLSLEFTALAPGRMVEVEGRAGLFREQVQVTVERMRVLTPEESAALELGHFLPAAPRPAAEMWEELVALCRKEFTHAPWRKFIFAVLRDEDIRQGWSTAPAAKGVHHAYVGGLLEHSLSVASLVLRLCDHYRHLDRQTLLAGALFHDLGKIWEFSGGLVNDYTDEGRLIGHTELALERLASFLQKSGLEPELARHFKHLILSHHGSYEFGAVRVPQTAEALLLHYADNIDAKMAQCRSIFENFEEDQTGWSPWQPTLSRYMHQPVRTPEKKRPASTRPARDKAPEEQCLSLLKV